MQKNKKKKIIHLISSLKIGGAEAVLVDLVRALGNDRFEHHVIYFHGGPHEERLRALGVQTYHIQGLVCRYDIIFFMRLYKTVRVLAPDCIHSSLWAANFLGRIVGRLLSIPTLCAVHLGVETDGFVRNSLDKYTLRLADRVIAISDVVAQSLYDRPWLVVPAKISVIKNGIDNHHVVALKNTDIQERSKYGLMQQHVVIGTVGRFIPRKNFLMLIHVFKELYTINQDCRLVLVGQGPQEAELRALVQELRLEDVVTFVVGKSAYGYYSLMDIFVLPSFQEGLSIALLEAMSCGLPSVIAHGGHEHDVIRSYENGIIVSPGNSHELLHAVSQLVENNELRMQLGAEGQKTVACNFSVDRMAQKYEELYNLK